MLRVLKSFALAGLALPFTQAVLVTPGSTCGTNCGNVLDSTVPNDITCSQGGYQGGQGQVFSGCVSCELRSGYSNVNQTDTQWALYNLRYAVSYCLFGTPENNNVISTPCITTKACGPFRNAIEFKNMSSDISNYDYCAEWPVTDHVDFKGCRECLRAGGQEYLANFITVLQGGCEQQPVANVPVSTEGNIFSHDFVNVTAPSPIATVDPKWFDNGPLSLGAKVGIAFGALVVILIVLGFFIVWNGKRRRRAYLAKLEQQHGHIGWPSPYQGQGDMRETPVSQRPLRGFDESPMSAGAEKAYPRYFSPYSSQYNSPVSAQDTLNSQWPAMHHTHHGKDPNYLSELHQSSFASRMAAMEASGQWVPTSPTGAYVHAPTPESYEMHEVDSAGSSTSRGKQRAWQETPVLGHPGYGRTGNSPPRTYSPEDDDKRPGGA